MKSKSNYLKFLLAGLAILLPCVASAQAECTLIAGYSVEFMGVVIHDQYWCCTGPEGCFRDIYVTFSL
jgi:hypothetical protein